MGPATEGCEMPLKGEHLDSGKKEAVSTWKHSVSKCILLLVTMLNQES